MGGHTYSKVIKGEECNFWSVTSLIGLFNELSFFSEKVYYRRGQAVIDGTDAHKIISEILLGKTVGIRRWQKLTPEVQRVLMGLVRWQRKTGFKVKYVNLKVYSPRFCFAGTIDAVGTIGRLLTLVDWKTGELNFEQLVMQLVLYFVAYLETFPGRTIRQLRGVYFDKKTGEFREVIISEQDIRDTLAKFSSFMGKIDIGTLRKWGNLENLKFRSKKIGGVEMESSKAIVQRQERGLIKEATSYNNAMQILTAWYPAAPDAEKIKAAQLIWYHRVPPNKIYLIPYKNAGRAKSRGCECVKFPCPHIDVYDWSTVMAIDAKRIIASKGRALSYVFDNDEFPRPMIEAEEIKHYKSTNSEMVRAICKIKDVRSGAVGFGIAEMPKTATVQGRDKGNSVKNMAEIRAESKALSRLPGVEMPDVEVIDERYVEEPVTIEEVAQEKPAITQPMETLLPATDKPTERISSEPQTHSDELPRPEEVGQKVTIPANLLIKTCPIHHVTWAKSKFGPWHYIDKEAKTYCRFRDVARLQALALLEDRHIPPTELDVLIDNKFQMTAAKLSPEGWIELMENIETRVPENFPFVKFAHEIKGLLSKLGWTETTLKAEKPNFKNFESLTGPQRQDMINHLIDKLAEKTEGKAAQLL